jgi:hypothetical protein
VLLISKTFLIGFQEVLKAGLENQTTTKEDTTNAQANNHLSNQGTTETIGTDKRY